MTALYPSFLVCCFQSRIIFFLVWRQMSPKLRVAVSVVGSRLQPVTRLENAPGQSFPKATSGPTKDPHLSTGWKIFLWAYPFRKHLKTEPKWIECVAFNPSRIGITLAPKTKKAKFESYMHCQIAAIDIRKKQAKSIFLPSLTKTRIIPTYPFQMLRWSCQFSPVVFFVHLQKSRCLRVRLGPTCHLHQGESWPASLKAGRKRCLEDDPRTCKWLVSPICK